MIALVAIDWGTSSFRAWAMDRNGVVLGETREGPGILAVEEKCFDAAMEKAIGPWLAGGVPVIASGMITSRNGWVETPYLPLPLDASALAGALVPHPGGGNIVHFVPGAVSDPQGRHPDVMRGEETEITGFIASGGREGLLVLPGTHSKWAKVEGRSLVAFSTCMTGEVFALLRDHSILGRLMPPEQPSGEAAAKAFRRGLEVSRLPGSLLARIFAARTQALFHQLPASEIADFLSGILIGDEVAAALGDHVGSAVTVIGRRDLAERYRTAIRTFGSPVEIGGNDMARRGLWEIAQRAHIVR